MPSAASNTLYKLAQQVVQPYTMWSTARAAMVTGSVAKGIADNYSDLDMSIFYDESLPDEETLQSIRRNAGGSDRKWTSGDLAEGAFIEAYELHGVEVQMIHTTITSWEATMSEILTNFKVDTPLPKALEGILVCRSLYGKEYIDTWKAQASSFPPALAEAMVLHYLKFFPAWGLLPHFQTRDATIWYHEILVESSYNLLGILSGLNNIYFTTFQFKRMERFVGQFSLAPVDFGQRVEALFHMTPELALESLERLVDETLALVEKHMPQISTAAARRRIGWRQQPWPSESQNRSSA